MTTDMSERVAVVAGAGAAGAGIGNGRAAAILLARSGAAVIVVDRKEDEGAGTVSMIEQEGGTAALFVGDVTDGETCERLASFTRDLYGPPQIVVNNVGIGGRGNVVTTEPDIWDRVMRINVNSIYHVSRALIPGMAAAGGGAIVNIGSISAIRPTSLTAYSTSKGAVVSLTQAMAVDHASEGIRVNAVLPGPVWTPMVGGDDMPSELRERRRLASPLQTEGTGWDVGNAVRFLASDEARWITGHALVVDGGVTLNSASR